MPDFELVSDGGSLVVRYTVVRGDVEEVVTVEITGTLLATDADTLPSPLDEAVATEGRAILQRVLEGKRADPPARLVIDTEGWSVE